MSAAEQAVDRVIEAADRARKDRDTAAAALARAGWELHELADGTLLALRWGRGRPLRDDGELQTFVRHVAGGA